MSGFNSVELLALLEPCIKRWVVEAVDKALPRAVTTDAEKEVQRLRDFHVAIERWALKEHKDGSRYCQVCGAWECDGHRPECLFRLYPRQ